MCSPELGGPLTLDLPYPWAPQNIEALDYRRNIIKNNLEEINKKMYLR